MNVTKLDEYVIDGKTIKNYNFIDEVYNGNGKIGGLIDDEKLKKLWNFK